MACGVPQVISLMTSSFGSGNEYTLLQITNPVWTLVELIDRGVTSVQGEVLILVLPAAAIVVMLLNLRSVAAELQYQRRSLPARVAEDEAELHPVPVPVPTNPWDAEDDS
jgi:hypothetical protein